MVRIISGTEGSGKSTKLCEMIKEELETSEREIILIVPEQQSVTWTAKMCAMLPASSNRRFSVSTFSFLPNSIFREYGGLSDAVVDEGTRALIVWRAMLSVKEQLKVYTAGDRGAEDKAVPFLMGAIEELKQSGVTPAAAEQALDELIKINETDEKAGSLSDLCARLSDAVHVYAAYNEILHENFVDRGDVLENLANTLKAHPYFKGKSVYLDSFFSLSAHEENILGLIISQADNVTVTCSCPANDNKRDDSIVFDDVKEFRKRTIKLANEAGREVEHISMTENYRHHSSVEFSAVEKDLYSSTEFNELEDDEKNALPPTEDIRIIKCGDRFDEAEACASIIKKLLAEGYRYSDIAVVARNITSREGILDNVLRRHGIKCFMSESTEISASPAVRLVLAALGVAAGGWQRNDVIRLYKTGMTPVSASGDAMAKIAGDIFENYTYTWNIRGRKAYTGEEWTMNPAGYADKFTDEGKEILKIANSVKEQIIPPLERLISVFDEDSGVATVRETAERIVKFAEEYGVTQRLKELSSSYDSLGMLRDAERTRRSWDYVCEILEKMVSVLGEVPLNVVRFARLFAGVATGMDKGTIPTGVDEVVLGSSSGVRLESVRTAILIGTVEDEFPAPIDDSKFFFNDSDKIALESVELRLSSPTTDMSLSREFFMFYRTALTATEKLYILAPVGKGETLSAPVQRVDAILAGLGRNAVSIFGKMPLSEILYDRESAEYLLSRRSDKEELKILRSLLDEPEKSIKLTARHDMVPGEERKRMSLSQSAIDKFVKCPFSYCCNYRFGISPEKKAEIKPNDIGTFIHAVFEIFFKEVTVEKLNSGISKEELGQIADRIVKEYIETLSHSAGHDNIEGDSRLTYLLGRLTKYVHVFIDELTAELAQSRFIPSKFELPVGYEDKGEGSAVPVVYTTEEGTEVFLRGFADRVDVYMAEDGKKYVRVVDYKTGSKDFVLDHLKHGLDVQMLIYLFSLWKNGVPGEEGDFLPAGAVYFETRPKVVTGTSITGVEENKSLVMSSVKRSGIILNDMDAINAMERSDDGTYRFVPLKTTKKNGLEGQKNAYLQTLDELGERYEELEKTITEIADSMLKGHAEAKPAIISGVNNPCDYCDFAYVCKSKKSGK